MPQHWTPTLDWQTERGAKQRKTTALVLFLLFFFFLFTWTSSVCRLLSAAHVHVQFQMFPGCSTAPAGPFAVQSMKGIQVCSPTERLAKVPLVAGADGRGLEKGGKECWGKRSRNWWWTESKLAQIFFRGGRTTARPRHKSAAVSDEVQTWQLLAEFICVPLASSHRWSAVGSTADGKNAANSQTAGSLHKGWLLFVYLDKFIVAEEAFFLPCDFSIKLRMIRPIELSWESIPHRAETLVGKVCICKRCSQQKPVWAFCLNNLPPQSSRFSVWLALFFFPPQWKTLVIVSRFQAKRFGFKENLRCCHEREGHRVSVSTNV